MYDIEKNLPNIYLFNPTCEYAVANGNASWQPNRLLQKMEKDLATLPMYLAKSEDFILTHQPVSNRFKDSIQQLNLKLPGFERLDTISSNERLINIAKNKLLPWGWSPVAHKQLAPLKNNCSHDFVNSPVFSWQLHYKDLYSKKFAQGILKSILLNFPSDHFLSFEKLTEICTQKSDFEVLLKKWGKLMVKAPWSSSGRGLQPVRKKPIHSKVWEKLLGVLKEQGYAIAEPYLNKVLDLSFQFELKKEKVTFIGISNFSTDYKGQYNGTRLNGLPDTLAPDVLEFAEYVPEIIVNPLIQQIEKSNLAKYYEGFFGLDTLIFRDEFNKLKINPCLEINVRQNMGLLSLQLQKLLVSGKKGIFKTIYKPGSDFFQFEREMVRKHPLRISGSKIESGFLSLTDANKKTLFGAYILV